MGALDHRILLLSPHEHELIPSGEANHREGITHTNTSAHMLGSHSQEIHPLTEDTSEKGTRDQF